MPNAVFSNVLHPGFKEEFSKFVREVLEPYWSHYGGLKFLYGHHSQTLLPVVLKTDEDIDEDQLNFEPQSASLS